MDVLITKSFKKEFVYSVLYKIAFNVLNIHSNCSVTNVIIIHFIVTLIKNVLLAKIILIWIILITNVCLVMKLNLYQHSVYGVDTTKQMS